MKTVSEINKNKITKTGVSAKFVDSAESTITSPNFRQKLKYKPYSKYLSWWTTY